MSVKDLMGETMEKVRSMVDVNTIIGDPIVTQDGTTLIPISKVTVGFGSAGTDFQSKNGKENAPLCFGGGGGAGISINPVAFVVVSNGMARILPVNMPADTTVDRLVEMIPGAVSGVSNFFSKRKGGEADETAASDTPSESETPEE
ncbi:MAG: GerW family sporulation protein [Butyricicoccaceae bacterium]